MKHIFIINPAAGQGKELETLRQEILRETRLRLIEAVIHRTNARGDAERTAARYAAELKDEEARFYACGGDGTLNEVINGAAGYQNISVGMIPIGTGNDTIRNFSPPEKAFRSVAAQLTGTPRQIDLLRCRGRIDGINVDRFCVNMINNGFDCNVVARAAQLKERPFLAGSAAYMLAVFEKFVRREGIRLTVYGDGEKIVDGSMLLCAVCNGSYCGGGIKSAPQASLVDGMLDLNIVNYVSRRQFLRFFPDFARGKHLERKDIGDLLITKKCRRVRLVPKDSESFLTCVDGEIADTSGLEVEICPGALRLIIPEH